MSSEHLISTVFVLKYAKRFSSNDHYFGRAAHKIALGMINQVSMELANDLHNLDGILPITISDLFQNDKDFHWMRITGLREDVVNALNELARLDGVTYDGWRLHYAITRMHDWSGEIGVADFLEQHWQAKKAIHLHFETATSIKSKGLYRPMPYPELIFKSLFERWQALIATPLPYIPQREVLDTFLEHGMSIRDYQIQFQSIQMKQAPLQAFTGDVHYHVENPSRALKRAAKRADPFAIEAITHYDDLTSLLNLLANFGFYSGVGVKTAQGMGMMRRLSTSIA